MHLVPGYPDPPCSNGHQARHYSGIAPGPDRLEGRLATQRRGGWDAAKLLQAQKRAGGSWVLISLEWSTQDRETQLKESGAGSRCYYCLTGQDPAGPAAGPGWNYLVHLDPPPGRRRKRAEPYEVVHWTGFTTDTGALLAATRNGGLNAAAALGLPKPRGGTWRLVRAERGIPARAQLTERAAAHRCPSCHSDRSRAGTAQLLAAIARGEVALISHPRHGPAIRWHTRYGQRRTSRGQGGDQGMNVTAAASALVNRGLAVLAAEGQGYGPGRPFMLTAQGLELLQVMTYATRQPRPGRADGLPTNRNGSLSRSRTSDTEKNEAGSMTSIHQAEHTALRKLDSSRRAERIQGPLPDDAWTLPPPAADPSWPLPPGAGIAAGASRRGNRPRRSGLLNRGTRTP